MALASQQARPASARSYMYAKRRRRPSRWLTVGGFAAVIAIGWLGWKAVAGFAASGDGEGDGDRPAEKQGAASTAENADTASLAASRGLDADTTNAAKRRNADRESNDDRDRGVLPNPRREDEVKTTDERRERDRDHGRKAQFEQNANASAAKAANPDPGAVITMGASREVAEELADSSNADRSDSAAETSGAPANSAADPLPSAGVTSNSGRALATDPDVAALIRQAEQFERANRLVDARASYNTALHHPRVGAAAGSIRDAISRLNETLVFSSTVVDGDPFAERYRLEGGDLLSTIAPKYDVDWRFIARINGISDPRKIRAGQSLKIVRGPFHAVIDKSEFRLDLYVGRPDSAGRRMFIRSFRVGLGEHDSTPVGAWVVRDDSKLINPHWTNPRTGESYSADDPKNPIGERWIGLQGADEDTKLLSGYGIHGTVEPESIGRQASMGCIRMAASDVELIYELLMEGESSVVIAN